MSQAGLLKPAPERPPETPDGRPPDSSAPPAAPDRPGPTGGPGCGHYRHPGAGTPGERAASAHKPVVTLADVSVTLGQYKALRRVTATVPLRSQTVVIGPNGAGKSTLVQTILGFLPHEGSLTFDPPSPRFGYVPQRLDYDRHLPLTVTEFLALGLTRRPLWLGVSRVVRKKVSEGLERVMASDLAARPLGALSGGETQRIMLAAALMSDPDILVLDEPATGVDINGEQLMCELLDGFKKDYTIIMVSHDLPTARAHGDWVICLNRRVVAQGRPEDVFRPKILAATFGLHQGAELWSDHKI
ncbi:MAG: metal ABC transporter ATP-binding protein [Deltaproteobacteria bacterium]|jgi:zinc transport system ATP-binding protein|nr:metal ABC transporter ATP-binding protein [Deltaproteobacteria bacterium]